MSSPRDALQAQNSLISRGNDLMSQGSGAGTRNRSDGRNGRSEDSWIEVASQPSSSSLSSATPNDDIVTTGLRIHGQHQRRRRRGPHERFAPQNVEIAYSHQPSSSQDEYEETESESDRIMSSSNEDFPRQPQRNTSLLPDTSSASEVAPSSDDEDDNSTALGLTSNTASFAPQPNAFSHPPVSQTSARSRTTDRPPVHTSGGRESRPGTRRNSRSGMHSTRRHRQQQRQQQHSPYNIISPSHQADHDAALRASLSTLLSCAAAARGIPKTDSQPTGATAGPTTAERNGTGKAEPSGLRLVPESVAMGDDSGSDRRRARSAGRGPRIPPSPMGAASPRVRRKASPSKDRLSGQPSPKRTRRTDVSESSPVISPTVMTWVISAGVVVLFSAISFSAGYVLGREVGRTEAGQGFYGNDISNDGMSGMRSGANCGKEAVRGGLRKFRWIGGGSGSGISV